MFLGVQNPNHIFVTSTADGVNWSEPQLLELGDLHPYPWRVRYHEDSFYNTVTYLGEDVLDLITSDDGVHWNRHVRIADAPPEGQKYFTEESELLWRPNGELWCVVRTSGGAHLYWSKRPYTSWQGGIKIGWCSAPVSFVLGSEADLKVAARPATRIYKAREAFFATFSESIMDQAGKRSERTAPVAQPVQHDLKSAPSEISDALSVWSAGFEVQWWDESAIREYDLLVGALKEETDKRWRASVDEALQEDSKWISKPQFRSF